MNLKQKLAIGLLVGGFIAAKVFVFLKPVGIVSVILGAILLIFTEPAEAR